MDKRAEGEGELIHYISKMPRIIGGPEGTKDTGLTHFGEECLRLIKATQPQSRRTGSARRGIKSNKYQSDLGEYFAHGRL